MLAPRILSTAVGLPLLLLLISINVTTTAGLASAAAAIGFYEFFRLSGRRGTSPLLLLGIVAAVLFTVDATIEASFTFPLVTGAVLAPFLLLPIRPAGERLPADWAWTVAGVFLVGWSLSHAVLLRQAADGRDWLLMVVILTFAMDTAAYLVGRAVGRRPMAPSISPGKTWEGAIGGLLVATGASVALIKGFDLDATVWQGVVLGLLVGVFGQAGDLAESMLKRAAKAKDAGHLIPGHGGLLDRLDSLIPGVVVVYYFLQYGIG